MRLRQVAAGGREREAGWERLEALYRSSRDDVYAYVITLLGDRASAEDVTALAFERAYARRRSFDRRRGDERAWLFGIARNAALDELRRRRRTASLLVEPETLPEESLASISATSACSLSPNGVSSDGRIDGTPQLLDGAMEHRAGV